MVAKAKPLAAGRGKPFGNITRGTTNPNRLRRVDRFIASQAIIRTEREPVVVDLGFGASPITAIELLQRLGKVNPNTHVVGVEIDRERVERGLEVANERLHFALGGFEAPMPSSFAPGRPATVIRCFNVLRQYDEQDVPAAWQRMQSRLAPGGLLVEGTCDEIGRVSSWVTLDESRPLTLTISLRLADLEAPSIVAERLPKALIHHNVPGERIHKYMQALDQAWRIHSGAQSPVQRWQAVARDLIAAGWPIVGDRKRWRLGELTVDWAAVSAVH
ncbi:MAG: hypothetical protein RL605_816 [Actinomycetota bacterium]